MWCALCVTLISHEWELSKPAISRSSQQPSSNHSAAWLLLQGLDVGDACEVKPTNKLLGNNVIKGGGGHSITKVLAAVTCSQ